MKKTLFLTNIIQDYHWGDKSSISSVLGKANDNQPEAELWMGTHPKGMSCLRESGESLLDFLLKNPGGLGNIKADSQGGLPFLFKLLAAGSPLSLQAHPTKKQAEEGFKRDNAARIALDAFNRNYKDDNHKPEIICALSEYTAMKGFRKPEEIAGFLRELKLENELNSFLALEKGENQSLKSFYTELMGADEGWKAEKVAYIKANLPQRNCPEWLWVKKLSEVYPDDIGILAPVFLNLIILQPGEALFLPAGELHAYLQGFGIELMAASDNVLRGGLTSKHMDLDELVSILDFKPADTHILIPKKETESGSFYPVPVDDFCLRIYHGDKGDITLPPKLPSISIVMEGEFIFSDGKTKAVKGDSFFVPADEDAVQLTGSGIMYNAAPGVKN